MSNISLRVAVAHRPPFVFVTDTGSGTTIYTGMLIDLWERIVLDSNFLGSFSYYVSPSNAGGVPTAAGVWNGVVGELVEGRADVALFPLTRTAARLRVIECSYSYLDQGLGLIVRNEVSQPGALSVLEPFATTLWITILCTVIAVALLFWLLDEYGRWIRARQLEALRDSGVLPSTAVVPKKGYGGNPVLISFAAAAGAPERPARTSWGVQVLYVAYCFFCLIVLSAYTANLTSYLAVRRSAVTLSGLQDIARTRGYIGVNPNGSTAAYFMTSRDTRATQLQPYVRYCDTDTCLAWLRDDTVQAFVSDKPALEYIAGQPPCDLATVGNSFGPGNLVIGMAKNASWMSVVNEAIQRFAEDGTLTSLYRDWFEGLSQCAERESDLDNSRLTISQMLGAFVFLLAGAVIAFITGTVENLKWCLAKAYGPYQEEGVRENAWSRLSGWMTRTGDLNPSRQPSSIAPVPASRDVSARPVSSTRPSMASLKGQLLEQGSRVQRQGQQPEPGQDAGFTWSAPKPGYGRAVSEQLPVAAHAPRDVLPSAAPGGGAAAAVNVRSAQLHAAGSCKAALRNPRGGGRMYATAGTDDEVDADPATLQQQQQQQQRPQPGRAGASGVVSGLSKHRAMLRQRSRAAAATGPRRSPSPRGAATAPAPPTMSRLSNCHYARSEAPAAPRRSAAELQPREREGDGEDDTGGDVGEGFGSAEEGDESWEVEQRAVGQTVEEKTVSNSGVKVEIESGV